MPVLRHQRHVGSPTTHGHRYQPVGGRAPVDSGRPVAKLAKTVPTPAVRRPLSGQAARVHTARRKRRVRPPAAYGHRNQPVVHAPVVPARPVAELAVPVVSPAVHGPVIRQGTSVTVARHKRDVRSPATHRHWDQPVGG